ncbi:MAG: response regulator [Spirochaetales bacterium]|nr:response regulator [Spirochaetales bacterium]
MNVLIVEDDAVSREILKAILGDYSHCDEAENGQIAVEKYRASLESGVPYDLICLDIMMPVMDGQAALREIRRVEAEKGIGGRDLVKVVMTTALEDPQNVMEAFVKGACEAYLTKPILPGKIVQLLVDFGLIEQE